jgi:hypothetical protein
MQEQTPKARALSDSTINLDMFGAGFVQWFNVCTRFNSKRLETCIIDIEEVQKMI